MVYLFLLVQETDCHFVPALLLLPATFLSTTIPQRHSTLDSFDIHHIRRHPVWPRRVAQPQKATSEHLWPSSVWNTSASALQINSREAQTSAQQEENFTGLRASPYYYYNRRFSTSRSDVKH